MKHRPEMHNLALIFDNYSIKIQNERSISLIDEVDYKLPKIEFRYHTQPLFNPRNTYCGTALDSGQAFTNNNILALIITFPTCIKNVAKLSKSSFATKR